MWFSGPSWCLIIEAGQDGFEDLNGLLANPFLGPDILNLSPNSPPWEVANREQAPLLFCSFGRRVSTKSCVKLCDE